MLYICVFVSLYICGCVELYMCVVVYALSCICVELQICNCITSQIYNYTTQYSDHLIYVVWAKTPATKIAKLNFMRDSKAFSDAVTLAAS